MARARNIKPAIMVNERLAELEPMTRLLFVYLWMLADREGRLEDRPKRIAVEALPYDRAADVEGMLSTLCADGFIERYSAAGRSVIRITNFRKHQSPHGTEKDSELPDENGLFAVHERGKHGYATGRVVYVNSDSTPVAVSDDCGLTVKKHPDSGFTDSLIPDSLIPDSGCSDSSSSGQGPAGADEAKKQPKQRRNHGTAEDHEAVRWMFAEVKARDSTAKEPNWDAWANDMRLMREQDGRVHRDACALFRWAQRDPFWCANVMSPAKLREKWDQLVANRDRARSPGGQQNRRGMTEAEVEAANAASNAEAMAIIRGAGQAAPTPNTLEAPSA